MANSQNMNMQLKGNINGAALANILLPHLISALSSNATLRSAIVNAIMPEVRAQAAASASQSAGGKKNSKTGL